MKTANGIVVYLGSIMNSFKIKVQNDKILNITDTIIQIISCINKDQNVYLFIDESADLEQLYMGEELFLHFLQHLCQRTNFDPKRITIEIENLIQSDCWPNIIRCYRSFDVLGGQMINFSHHKDIKYKTSLFVGGSRWPRLTLASHLYNNHREDSLITYWQNLKDTKQPCNLYIDDVLRNFMPKGISNDLLKELTKFIDALPLHLNKDDHKENNNGGFIHWADAYDLLPHYNHVYCDVVCETVHNGKTFAFTEKIARCWMTKTPFIAFGPKNYLKNLKRIGFRTFDTFWNEDYDRYENATRIILIQRLINKIHGMDYTKIKDIYHSPAMQDILQHNWSLFKNLNRKKILDCFI